MLKFNLILIIVVSYGGIEINLSTTKTTESAGIFTSSSYDANAVDFFVRLGCQKLSL